MRPAYNQTAVQFYSAYRLFRGIEYIETDLELPSHDLHPDQLQIYQLFIREDGIMRALIFNYNRLIIPHPFSSRYFCSSVITAPRVTPARQLLYMQLVYAI